MSIKKLVGIINLHMRFSWGKVRKTRTLAQAAIFVVMVVSFAIFCDSCPELAKVKAADGEDITISANTTWNAGTYTYHDITVTNNATLTLGGTYTTDSDGTGVIINARNITITAGAKISANARGYAANAGTGKGNGTFGSGAGYGGAGAVGGTGNAGGIVYGSPIKPQDLGSGGGGDANAGAGGGAIKLSMSGDLTLGGSISANAGAGGFWRGGGSGGSVYIIANNLTGAGTITATGGNGGNSSGSGGGGRVAVYHNGTNGLTTSNITANGGTGGTGPGTAGSVFLFDRGNKDLTISSNLTLTPYLGIDTNGDPATDGVFNFRNLSVTNNASLIAGSKYTTDSDGSGMTFNLSGDLTVNAGSKIDAKGQGYAKNSGEGKGGVSGNTYGGGGAHGGNGGRGEIGAGGASYDSTLFPTKLGSGGVTTRGAAGGGIINITANEIIVNGSLDASAGAASGDGGTQGSGGAGGTVYLVASSVTGSGTILADGSNGYGYSGGGGGGRIAIYGDTSAFTANNITAAKGLKGGSGSSADGSIGTVFLYNTATGNVIASSDVTFEATQGVSRDGTARSDGVFYFNNFTVTNNATVTIGGTYSNDSDGRGVTINLDGTLTVYSGSKITANGKGYTGANGPGKGTGASSTSGSGGSYGGLGGRSYSNDISSAIYGVNEANFPYRLGSGGGAGNQVVGAAGGGAMTIRALGNIVNNGTISADGSASIASPTPGWYSGAGSGGSVFLVCNSLSGSGILTAEGGNGNSVNYSSGGGGGGRISVVYTTTQGLPLGNFSADGGAGGITPTFDGATGSVNITQRILPAATFTLKNPNNNSTEFTNTENVQIVPADGTVEKYKDAASVSELVPTFYASGWANVADGKDVGTSEGSKTVRAWFKDGNELISSSVGSATITLDSTDPTAEITNNNQTTAESSATINLTLDDNLSGIDYVTVNGQTVAYSKLKRVATKTKPSAIKAYADSTTLEATVDLEVGSNEIPIITYDKAGNSTTSTFIATRTQIITPTPTPTEYPSSAPADSTTIPSAGSISSTNETNSDTSGNQSSTSTTGFSGEMAINSTGSATANATNTPIKADQTDSNTVPQDQKSWWEDLWMWIAGGFVAILAIFILIRVLIIRDVRSR